MQYLVRFLLVVGCVGRASLALAEVEPVVPNPRMIAMEVVIAELALREVGRYLTWMRTVVSSKGQIVLPAELREQDRIRPGQRFDIERLEAGRYLLKKSAGPENEGVVDWLLACPEKDWVQFVPSESTDTL